jgi:hypothetical protein
MSHIASQRGWRGPTHTHTHTHRKRERERERRGGITDEAPTSHTLSVMPFVAALPVGEALALGDDAKYAAQATCTICAWPVACKAFLIQTKRNIPTSMVHADQNWCKSGCQHEERLGLKHNVRCTQ